MPATPIAAMLLAAGRGERMRPLTDTCPKPLLLVRGKPLLQWHLEALTRGGFNRVVLNTAWLGEQIEQSFGTGFVPVLQTEEGSPSSLRGVQRRGNPAGKAERSTQRSLQIAYSHEGRDFGAALETAGGIARALPLLCPIDQQALAGTHPKSEPGTDMFWLMAADVFAPGFNFTQGAVDRFIASGKLAHLWLVPNPPHNLAGDFGLDFNAGAVPGELSPVGLALNLPPNDERPRYTYSTIGLYRQALFEPPLCRIPVGNPQGLKAPLAPLLRTAMDNQLVSAELYEGAWTDVGTPPRLAQLNE